MDEKLILQLNQLNQHFYESIGRDFDDSRQYAWSGWQQVLGEIRAAFEASDSPILMDLGCGNARFGTYVAEQLKTPFHYIGVDSNDYLLEKAKQAVAGLSTPAELRKLDIVTSLLQDSFTSQLSTRPITVISAMGLLHHIPSHGLRQQLIAKCWDLLEPGGLLIITTWQFMLFERLRKKIVSATAVNIVAEKLEPDDYFLDWQRGQTAVRYCHYISEAELNGLIRPATDTPWKIVKVYEADGKEGNVNRYWVLQKLSSGG